MSTFWKHYLTTPLRIICLVIIIVAQPGGVIGRLTGIGIMLAISWLIQRLLKIDWRSPNTQVMVDCISIILALYFVLDRIGLASFLGNLILYFAVGVAILAVIVIVLSKRK